MINYHIDDSVVYICSDKININVLKFKSYMNHGVKKGTRMVYWEVLICTNDWKWYNPHLFMTKRELKKFLSEFNAKDWSHYGDIFELKILRNKRVGTTMTWDTEFIGYTEVTPQGTLYHIEF